VSQHSDRTGKHRPGTEMAIEHRKADRPHPPRKTRFRRMKKITCQTRRFFMALLSLPCKRSACRQGTSDDHGNHSGRAGSPRGWRRSKRIILRSVLAELGISENVAYSVSSISEISSYKAPSLKAGFMS
jgi:hypothetical protein